MNVGMGHGARNKRAAIIASRMIRHPALSIPKMSATKSESKAAYEFFSNIAVKQQDLLSGHFERTAQACLEHPCVLVIQDTMTAHCGGQGRNKQLGLVGTSAKALGMFVHTALAVAEDGSVLGVLGQETWVRSNKKHPRFEDCRQRKLRPRESEVWFTLHKKAFERLSKDSEQRPRVIAVFDREGDIFEVFEQIDSLGDSFVIRASRNRLIESQDPSVPAYSLEQVRQGKVLAHMELDVPACPGRAARKAKLEVRALRVTVFPPKNRNRKGPSQWMNIVLVDEIDPPSKKKALTWYLVTREPIDTEKDVLRVVKIYKYRWLIEELHMGLKTGCSLEQRELETEHALKNFLALATVASVELLRLRCVARAPDSPPATDVLTKIQLKILGRYNRKLSPNCTAREALRAIGMMGGFIGSSKQEPGWRSLWAGYQKLWTLEQGYLLAVAPDN